MSTSAIYIPREDELLSELSAFRSAVSNDQSSKAPNAKAIMRHFSSAHPDWMITHSRLVKALKLEKEKLALSASSACPTKYVGDNDENVVNSLLRSDSSTSIGNSNVPLMSPKSKAVMLTLDSPVSKKNILPTRLRPASVLSMVYGKVLRKGGVDSTTTTPQKERDSRLASDRAEEAEDPTFVPAFDESPASKDADKPEPFSRDALRQPLTATIRTAAAAPKPSPTTTTTTTTAPPKKSAAAGMFARIPTFSPIKFKSSSPLPAAKGKYDVMTPHADDSAAVAAAAPTPVVVEPLCPPTTTAAETKISEVLSCASGGGLPSMAAEEAPVKESEDTATANPMMVHQRTEEGSEGAILAALYEPERREEKEQVSCFMRCSIM